MAINTVSNTELERELIVSKLLSESLLPPDFTKLVIQISELPIIDTSEIMQLDYEPLLKMLVKKMNLLDLEKIKQYHYGKLPELLQIFSNLESGAHMLIPIYDIKIKQIFEEALMEADMGSKASYQDIAESIDTGLIKQRYMSQYNDVKVQLQQLQANLRNIILQYGMCMDKISFKEKMSPFDTKYQLYIQDMCQNLDKYVSEPTLAMVLGKVITAIVQLNPSISLDPYKKDLFDNVMMILKEPKKFYELAISDEIIDSASGSVFGYCYPEFYQTFLDIFIEDYDKYDYQKLIEIRRAFGLPEDNSQILNLCSQFVNVIVNNGTAAQGV